MKRILITGGAGFIGTHLVDALVPHHEVVVLDSLVAQVHGPGQRRPDSLHPGAELVVADVRDASLVDRLVRGTDIVVHLAACTGVGQSMYQIRDYFDVNVTGTAVLLEACRRSKDGPGRVVVASSRAVYGEGRYECDRCGGVVPPTRQAADLAAARWDPPCPVCGGACRPVPTSESTAPAPGSIYAISKLAQEHAVITVAGASGIEGRALRFFNVYGPGQSSRNPYTGVVNAFIARSLNGRPADLYEDGLVKRDFVHVQDVVGALVQAILGEFRENTVNVGTGIGATLQEVASQIADELDAPGPVVTGAYRLGDVRHIWSDNTRANQLGIFPTIGLADGLRELAGLVAGSAWSDRTSSAEAELVSEGLGGIAQP